jgi:hypothetical protein
LFWQLVLVIFSRASADRAHISSSGGQVVTKYIHRGQLGQVLDILKGRFALHGHIDLPSYGPLREHGQEEKDEVYRTSLLIVLRTNGQQNMKDREQEIIVTASTQPQLKLRVTK